MILGLWFDVILVLALLGLCYLIFFLSQETFDVARSGADHGLSFQPESYSPLFPYKLIRQAGINSSQFSGIYWVLKVALAFVTPMLANEFSDFSLSGWHLAAISAVAFVLLDGFILLGGKKRKEEISRSLSYFLDLLVVFLESGLSLEQAFERAGRFGLSRKHPLAREVRLTIDEMQAGRSWQQAFEKLAVRTGVRDLERLSVIMGIGYSTGVPLADSLSAQAELLREKQVRRVEELTSRKALESLLPIMLMSIPMFLVFVFFPTGVQIHEAYMQFRGAW